jgi:hypothetical protein
MKKSIHLKTVILLTAILTVSMVFYGCQSMEDSRHNAEDGRDGVSGYALTMTINPSRVPANSDAKTYAHIRFFRMKDGTPVQNTQVRLTLGAGYYDLVHFGDHTLMTDVITNQAGEATVTMYVESLPKYIEEIEMELDAQSTIEYDKWNTLVYTAREIFYVYNPHWDGTKPPYEGPPTAEINIFPSSGAQPDTVITFDGTMSHDGPADDPDYYGIVSYEWYLGDGTFKQGSIVTHVYNEYGEFPITLKVRNRWGLTNIANDTVVIEEPEEE